MQRPDSPLFDDNNNLLKHVAKRGETWGWLSDTLESLRETIGRRMGNPVVSSFLLSWLAFNYEIWLTVLGNGTSSSKIEFIKKYVATERSSCELLWWPTLFAFAFPVAEVIFSGFAKWLDNWRKGLLIGIDQRQPVASEEREQFFRALKEQADLKNAELSQIISQNRQTAASWADYANELHLRIKEVSQQVMLRQLALSGVPHLHDSVMLHRSTFYEGLPYEEIKKATDPGMADLIRRVVRLASPSSVEQVTSLGLSQDLQLPPEQMKALLNNLCGLGLVEEKFVAGQHVIRYLTDGEPWRKIVKEADAIA